jgi:hypothetical protein
MRVLLMVRELAGWFLLCAGLLVFGLALMLLLEQRLFEAVPAVGIGWIIFRGGIHLLKSALALQVVWQMSARPATPRPYSSAGTSWAALPASAASVLPRTDAPVMTHR